MSVSTALSVSAPAPVPPRPLWSRTLTARARGLALAREANVVLAWDEANVLVLFDRHGRPQAENRAGGFVTAISIADDGSGCAAVGAGGEVWWLAPDLTPRWQKAVPHPACACALDAFGQYLAVADTHGGLHLFDRTGRSVGHSQAPRALHHLLFIPEQPLLIGAADIGLLAAFEPDGRMAWRLGLVTNLGALDVTGDGSRIVLACFTDGVRFFSSRGTALGGKTLGDPCSRVAVSYDGRILLTSNLGNRLLVLDDKNRPRLVLLLEHTPAAFVVDALGETAVVALGRGQVSAVDLRGAR